MVKLPKRYKPYGVGKFIGGSIYLHRDYDHLIEPQEKYQRIKNLVPGGWTYHIIKQNLRTGAFTFIRSDRFDSQDEPIIEKFLTITPDKTKPEGIRFHTHWGNPSKRKIYHHKWLFVKDDYPRFNVNESKERSRLWMFLDGIDYSRIGNYGYWQTNVIPRIKKHLTM